MKAGVRALIPALLVLGLAAGCTAPAPAAPAAAVAPAPQTSPGPAPPAPETFDLIIAGGTVYDGTGAPGRRADVGIRGDRIVKVGDLQGARAARTIAATGLAVAPGFIDPHNHTWDTLPDYPTDPDATSMIMQGITTVVGGVDGRSGWPIAGALEQIEQEGTGVNYATLVGQGTVRAQVVGNGERPATAAEMAQMQELVRQGMAAGAFGLSTGLEYAPGRAADTAEVTALAQVAAAGGGIYSSHVRSERRDLLGGVAEALAVGKAAGLPVNLSHLKLVTPAQWEQADQLFNLINRARSEGQPVFADVYPYLAPDYMMNLPLAGVHASYPPEAIYIRQASQRPLIGKTLAKVAADTGRNAQEAARALVAADPGIRVAVEVGRADLMIRLIQADFAVAGTDGEAQPFYPDPDQAARLVHPRSYGSYPKYLRLVRERRILPLDAMIRKLTGAVADQLHLQDRGYIRPGAYADVVLFDPDTVADRATWWAPQEYPVGIRFVLVNGQPAVAAGKHEAGARHGQVLRHQKP